MEYSSGLELSCCQIWSP